MKVLVIGGVAAGTKAAAKLKRCNRDLKVKILTKSRDISYAACGLPYYIGGAIENAEELIVNTPEKFIALTGTNVVTGCEVTRVDVNRKTVSFVSNEGFSGSEAYDKLILATGADAFVPDVKGILLKGVFSVRTTDDAVCVREYLAGNTCRNAVVCGAGFIGLEIAESLLARGLQVTVLEAAATVMPTAFDSEMAEYVRKKLKDAGVRVLTGTKLLSFSGEECVQGVNTDSGLIPADMAVIAMGIRPSTAFLSDSGIELERGLVVVDGQMRTNIPDVYAAGDCAMVRNLVTGQPMWSAMGSTANLTARLLAKVICGGEEEYRGCLGTGVAKLLPDLRCARTGLTEAQAREAGYDVISAVCVLDDKAHYYPDASSFVIKVIADRESEKLLGVQVLGSGTVEKLADIAAMAISMSAKLSDLNTVDFAYAPPFSTAIHPLVTACYLLENKRSGALCSVTPKEYLDGMAKGDTVIDVHPEPRIPGAKWIDLAKASDGIAGVAKDEKLLLVCARGRRSYLLQNILRHEGYVNTRTLEGGTTLNDVKAVRHGKSLPPEEVKRVKGLGCLKDKRFEDIFNVRVITRNGKLTSKEQMAVAEAAKRFGSGEVTMTTRLTLEIQGVPYDRLEEVFEFLAQNGLETGGTGSRVRPVVSCKGTTCQYGLIDTFDLSEKLHERFYVGYHDLTLPHKFKIAVGGCPNNCVKPNLNDIGIIGQRIPAVDPAQCRNCRICQVQRACPVQAAKLENEKIRILGDVCNRCGRCIEKCPFGALREEAVGYKVYIGGRWGKKTAQGRELRTILRSEEDVMELVDRAILLFREEGITGERFSDTVERVGFDIVEDKLLNGKMNKEEIKKKQVRGGASC